MASSDATTCPPEALVERLRAFASDGESPLDLLPWAFQLAPVECARLRDELALVLAEPAATGEPLDWHEVLDILHEWAEYTGWTGALIQDEITRGEPVYTVDLRGAERGSLESAPSAVRAVAEPILSEFLPYHPISGEFLTRGRLKKLSERDLWQIDLPDGYRLRYYVDELNRTVHVVYLGPHPDTDPRGRERSVRARVQRARHGG
jgi:hypothetical protein